MQGVIAAEIKGVELSIRCHQSLPSLELDPAPRTKESILRPCLVPLEAVEREPSNAGSCLQNADLLLQLRDVSFQLHDFERIALGNAGRVVGQPSFDWFNGLWLYAWQESAPSAIPALNATTAIGLSTSVGYPVMALALEESGRRPEPTTGSEVVCRVAPE